MQSSADLYSLSSSVRQSNLSLKTLQISEDMTHIGMLDFLGYPRQGRRERVVFHELTIALHYKQSRVLASFYTAVPEARVCSQIIDADGRETQANHLLSHRYISVLLHIR